MNTAECPSCGALVNFSGQAKLGLRVICKVCDTESEVVWLDPLELDWPYDEDDAYDYEDEEESAW